MEKINTELASPYNEEFFKYFESYLLEVIKKKFTCEEISSVA